MEPTSGIRRLTLCLVWTFTVMHYSRAQETDIVFYLEEEKPAGTYVGNVATASGVDQYVTDEELPLLEYTFLNPSNSKQAALFRINSNDGSVYTTRRIDREVLCQNSLTCETEADVTIKSSASIFLKLFTIKFVIEDINDNSPIFTRDVITLYIPESAIVGTNYGIEGAVDKDMGPNNSIQSYELLKPNSAFGIESEKKLDGSSIVKIVLLKKLNREHRDLYNFYVLAKDGGKPQKTGSVAINVNVRDVNDNPPVFHKDKYTINVAENTRVNSIIGRVKATDKDIVENGRVSYRFSPLRPSKLEDLLSINPVSGELTVKSPLQYESGKTYDTIVEATDNGNPPQVSQTALIVKIIDVGNNPPKLKLNLASPVNSDTILQSEGSMAGTFVGHIKVEDRDPGLNGVVKCRSEEPYFRVQKLDGKGYALLTSKLLDREKSDKHNVEIVCEDSGTPSLSSYVTFNVVVTDINDNAPKFLRSTYYANVTENSPKGVLVTRVAAIDRDTGVNSQFNYHLNWDSNSMFKIDPESGIITTSAVFDRETMKQVKFTVKAVDQGKSSLVGSTTVVVNILDENDNIPIIDPESLSVRVIENIPVGGDVGTITGTDEDEGRNAELEFRLKDKDPRLPFVVFADGTIRTIKSLDREKRDKYEFDVMVSDKGYPSRSSYGHVVVAVMDFNDHYPVIEFPNSANDSVIVLSDLKPGSVITKVMAYDEDLENNGQLSYSFTHEKKQNMFLISRENGEVSLARRITPEDKEYIQMRISVQDQGSPQLESRENLNVKIIFTNATLAARKTATYGYKYMIIAGVVAGITIILSILIVVAIIRLKQSSSRYNGRERTAVQEQGDDKSGEKEALKNHSPKRVTLANADEGTFEFFMNSKMEKDPKFNMNKSSGGNIYEPPPTSDQYGKQEFLTFKKKALNDDVRSDISGETASDSGRGTSEDEIHLTILAGGDGSYRRCQVSLSPDFEDFLPPPPYVIGDKTDQSKQLAHVSTYPKPRAIKKEGNGASLHNISKSNAERGAYGTLGYENKLLVNGSSGKLLYQPSGSGINDYPTIEMRRLEITPNGYKVS
ncbi:hypothetical protein SNE40_016698 [Patella caerulea]|uniref:Cadherin domain-containing protein n=1 Tax=Patella caerulea TaxID=87958 RepID=A0AAN8P8L1_PATCE